MPARTSPTLHPPSPPTVHQLSPLALLRVNNYCRSFNTVTYSADGQCILAAGRSKNVCIYSVADQLLLKKFEITCNRSLDGTQVYTMVHTVREYCSVKGLEMFREKSGSSGLCDHCCTDTCFTVGITKANGWEGLL